MFMALISFLGGNAFRLLFGEVVSFLNKKQDHEHEMALQRLQSELEAQRHQRDMERIKQQADLNVREVQVVADAAINRAEVEAWAQAVADVGKQTGIRFLDIWNGSIRPLLATLAILVVVVKIGANGFILDDWDRELVAAILGIYVADRSLAKRGK